MNNCGKCENLVMEEDCWNVCAYPLVNYIYIEE